MAQCGMCGIAGIITSNETLARSAVAAMADAQRHRGPDDAGDAIQKFGDGFLAFGFRRLAILDLSSAGHQPMSHPQTGDQLMFNGEIYNFAALRRELETAGESFIGHSDTEVLLHGLSRFGPAYLSRLQGMYALGFFDARQRTLLLARDPVGIKPLYIARAGETFLFASEVRAILASGLIPPRHSPQGLATLLAYGAVQEPFTIIDGIRAFPAGCFQVIRPDGQGDQPIPFWEYPQRPVPTRQDIVTVLAGTLEDAVRDHLVADVPVGVFLSSGLDSTVVAGLAARHTTRLRSFTVGFADQPDLSELHLAGETARHFGLDHHEIEVTGPEAEAAAAEWIQRLDQPSVDGMNTFIISKVVRRAGITVALCGQGGDELFGGYPSFYDVGRLRRMMGLMRWLPRSCRLALAKTATLARPQAVQQKFREIVSTSGSVTDLYFQRRRLMSAGQMKSLGIDPAGLGLCEYFQDPQVASSIHATPEDIVWSISQLECRFYQGNMLLRDTDANGMAHTLEIRVPMLDQRVLDLMLPVPGDVRLPNGINDKHLLRTAFRPLLRPELLSQSKRGFALPIRRWMLGPMRQLCENAIASLKCFGAVREEGVDAIWRSFLAEPESQIWSRAFMLCVLGMYVQQKGLQ